MAPPTRRDRARRPSSPRRAPPPLLPPLLLPLLFCSPALLLAADPDVLRGDVAGHGAGRVDASWESVHLSWRPRAQLLRGFLSPAECDALVSAAAPLMKPSTVVNSTTGEDELSTVRTSTGHFFDRGSREVPVIAEVQRRVALATMLPVEHQEGVQILHYRGGQEYQAHHDFFWDEANQVPERGGQRLVTILMYLSTPEEGGETVFPLAERRVTGPGFSDCARKGLAVRPRKGDALVFYALTPDGRPDESSLHASCPTTRGDKLSATVWVHALPFAQPGSPGGPEQEARASRSAAAAGLCVNLAESCGEWSFFGECAKNPAYMHAACRASCRQCLNGTAAGLASALARSMGPVEDDGAAGDGEEEDGAAAAAAAQTLLLPVRQQAEEGAGGGQGAAAEAKAADASSSSSSAAAAAAAAAAGRGAA